MAVILDASESTFRNQMYDGYKAHRPPPPEDLVPQFPLIRTATRAFSIPCIEEDGLEADDIIACYVTAAKEAGWRVTIVSSDKDLMQLVEDGTVDMLDTMNDRRITEKRWWKVRGRAGQGRRRARADGRQRRQCAGRAGDWAKDRKPADPAIRQPGDGACKHRPDHQAQTQAEPHRACRRRPAVARAGAAGVRRQAAEPLDALALTGIPEEPLREFLAEQGFKTLLTA
jgi:DNA polymerase-1